MNLSQTNISFLKDVNSMVNVDKTSGWRHHYFDGLSIEEINTFLKLIGDDKIYLIIPLFATSKLLSNPSLILSEPLFVNNKSNPELITKFILDQWNNSGFNINEGTLITFSFKFKRVWFSYK